MTLRRVAYRTNPVVNNDDLNALFSASWPGHQPLDFAPVLTRSLAYICGYSTDSAGEQLIGYVNLA